MTRIRHATINEQKKEAESEWIQLPDFYKKVSFLHKMYVLRQKDDWKMYVLTHKGRKKCMSSAKIRRQNVCPQFFVCPMSVLCMSSVCPRGHFLKKFKSLLQNENPWKRSVFKGFRLGCGRRTWTNDLRVMSPTSYQLLYPAIYGTFLSALSL